MDNFVKKHNKMANASMMKHYLLKEQGFEDDAVNDMSYEELKECYDYYHEEYYY